MRAQIVLALSLVFAGSFWLAGFTALQLTRRSTELAEARSSMLAARTLASALQTRTTHDDASDRVLCDALKARAQILALRIVYNDGKTFTCGTARGKATVRTAFGRNNRVFIWFPPSYSRAQAPLTDILFFYLALTGLAVLLLAYVALTYLIVRPLERLTLSAEELRAGGEHVFVREQGSAEAVRLAQTFNEMATLLRAERKRLVDRLDELERTTEALAHKEQQLIHGEKLASIGRLAAGIAHEIGNPLAAILGLVELLREGGLSESEAREFLARVHRETERINYIIRDLLDFARHDIDETGTLDSTDLQEVISDAVSLVRPQKESKDIEISVSVAPSTRRVLGPQHRLTQVVLNLLLNAVDALAGKGRIEISVSPAPDGKHVLLVVADDGPGIVSEMLDKLFDPFTTTKPVGKGTGLGLAVTHAIVDGLAGTIHASNRTQGGAVFEVLLRAAPAPAAGADV